ncbi:MAG: radical SAM protein [SAR324 cluster bacterium]|nr:radical SAM protein [SAR324 cluster bacterium]
MRFHYEKTPKYIQIETTISCNATCWFCPQKHATRRPMFMEEKVWKKIIDETRGLGVIYRPFILNEPFVDRRMAKIIRYIKEDATASVEFNTNGEALIPKRTDEIIEAGVDIVRFSVDGIDRKTFDEARGISYDKVYANVEYFIKAANESEREIQTEVRMIKFPGTEEEQKAFENYWKVRKPTSILFTELYRYPWEGQTEALNLPCLKILDEMYFYVDGRATLCCWDSKERQIVGDVKTEHVLDIWNGKIMKHCRELLDEGKRAEINLCSRCDAYEHFDFDRYFAEQNIQSPVMAEDLG